MIRGINHDDLVDLIAAAMNAGALVGGSNWSEEHAIEAVLDRGVGNHHWRDAAETFVAKAYNDEGSWRDG